MNDVVRLAVEHRLDRPLLEPRPPRLLCEERGEPAPPAPQFVAPDAGMLTEGDLWLGRVEKVVCVDAVHHIHVVAAVGERMRETVDVHRVPAEAVRRVERGEVQKAEGSTHRAATERTTARIC